MKWLFVVLSMVLYEKSIAMDQWFCTQSASKMVGSDFYACGVDESSSESAARLNAATQAQGEFYWLCEASQHCQNNKWKMRVEPKRTECEKTIDPNTKWASYKCVRLIVFHMAQD